MAFSQDRPAATVVFARTAERQDSAMGQLFGLTLSSSFPTAGSPPILPVAALAATAATIPLWEHLVRAALADSAATHLAAPSTHRASLSLSIAPFPTIMLSVGK